MTTIETRGNRNKWSLLFHYLLRSGVTIEGRLWGHGFDNQSGPIETKSPCVQPKSIGHLLVQFLAPQRVGSKLIVGSEFEKRSSFEPFSLFMSCRFVSVSLGRTLPISSRSKVCFRTNFQNVVWFLFTIPFWHTFPIKLGVQSLLFSNPNVLKRFTASIWHLGNSSDHEPKNFSCVFHETFESWNS